MSFEGPRRGPGARAPLFDRLFDLDPRQHEELHPHRVHGRAEMVESIRTELARLLNTRCAVSMDGLRGQTRTVINYGLPDFTSLNPTSDRDRERLAVLLGEAIRAYEPRLQSPRVAVEFDPERPRELRMMLYASLLIEGLIDPVAFPLQIDVRGGPVSVGPPDDGPPPSQG